MRDLLYKNLTSSDGKRKIVSACEIVDRQGVRSIINRHFACIIKEIKDANVERPSPYLYVLKDHNTKDHRERFFCRIKGSIFAKYKDRLFMIVFMHSLKINLQHISQGSVEYSEEG